MTASTATPAVHLDSIFSGPIDFAAVERTLALDAAHRSGIFTAATLAPCPEGEAVTLADGTRFYNVGGSMLPSVTSVLGIIAKPGLVKWAERQGEDRVLAAVRRAATSLRGQERAEGQLVSRTFRELGSMRTAEKDTNPAALGTAAHRLIEWHSRKLMGEEAGPESPMLAAVAPAVMAWLRWAKETSYRPIYVEHLVSCAEDGCRYAGSLDALAWVEGVPTLCDWKRGAMRAGYRLQAAAYGHAVERVTGIRPERAIVLTLPREDGDAEPHEISGHELTGLLGIFKHARALWGWERGGATTE